MSHSSVQKKLALTEALASVREFHTKFGFSVGRRLADELNDPIAEMASRDRLMAVHTQLDHMARQMESGRTGEEFDDRILRTHLQNEEHSERVLALAKRNEVALFDALCDELYVLIGCAVAFDMPIDEGFEEVHRSNMSKSRTNSGPGRLCETVVDGDIRMRNKGPNYSPPDLESILRAHRARKLLEKDEVERNRVDAKELVEKVKPATEAPRCLRCDGVIHPSPLLGGGPNDCRCKVPNTTTISAGSILGTSGESVPAKS